MHLGNLTRARIVMFCLFAVFGPALMEQWDKRTLSGGKPHGCLRGYTTYGGQGGSLKI